MSFLSGGPECSTGANPLAQFQKQTSADTSLQRDRLTQRAPQLNAFRTQQQGGDEAAFREFSEQQQGLGGMGLEQEQGYREQQMFLAEQQQEMERMQQQQQRVGGGGGWAGEFAGQPAPVFSPELFAQQQGRGGAFSPQDFSGFRQQQERLSSISRGSQNPVTFQQPQSTFQRPPMYGSTFGGGSGFGMQQRPMMFQAQQRGVYGQQPPQQEQYEGKGKGRIQELSDTDWEKQFEELSTVDKDQEAEMDQLDREAERDIEAELNRMDRSEGFGEFEDIWQGYQAETNAARDLLADEGHMGEYDEWKDFDGMGHDFDGLRTFENRGPENSNYLFEENNLFGDVPNAFEEGMKIMREGGSLSLAALAFEAAVQKQPELVEAWVALGSAQAQNEKESPAIRAMEQALKLDPDNLDALMGLSVSYTNEGYDSLAYRTLERWVGVKYPQLGVPLQTLDSDAMVEEEMGFTDRHQLHEKVTALFLQAAQLNPEGMDLDIDVQVGLGVLFYGSEDYDKAVDCFTAALDSAENGTMKREGEEHLLWNRLGATLANSGRSEEAIEAYSRALELRGNFVRARYNLGVSCINLGVLEQAAGHLLGALSMHRVIEREGRRKAAELVGGGGSGNEVDDRVVEGLLRQNQSTNLYDTLRRVFSQMERRDLAEGVGPDMDLEALRGQGFDF
ncbi:Peroxisomal membrane signal receptor PTS1 [Friedmanniomyces endolithicus]|uniref:Peroxisomal targeting signal receptor n=1 Tax=Friedmanniomyces endolithicus TaxID=329885 RepID=A0AAN6HAU6_9PEZI|nr:Peroxisomal membrane signal receptor PTS1 [Friedmanniomyces endolithicus]KAK0773739.1 Peroxisomal membrane signal receptor PTS1 [Friedmanniomyces endolithicus]KAK0789257.1 Peroxisomal membrane signal receptor PTS1 [Friedmanniomyces endolithicus]KAK0826611.1 Peroxisomal membrane signal receptor PTS1 [Friedmanniomyces endolithicus]KAK0905955.1 Peroxisomal membrane signal receptor PTS1 [Friedmanniomyces endolithicus]